MQHTGNAVWPSDGTPRNGSTPVNGSPAHHDGLVILSPQASAALQALRERARQHESAPPAHEPTHPAIAEQSPVVETFQTGRPLPPPPPPAEMPSTPIAPSSHVRTGHVRTDHVATGSAAPWVELDAMAQAETAPLRDATSVADQAAYEQAVAQARAEAAAVVAAARAQAVSLIADAVAEVRDERGAVLPPTSVTVVLDPETFARSFAVAIAAVLENRPETAATATVPPATPPGAAGRQIIDLGADFISPHQALQLQIQQAQAFQAAQQAGSLWARQAPPPAKSFWSNAWHPDVLLSVVAMIIVLVILVAFAA